MNYTTFYIKNIGLLADRLAVKAQANSDAGARQQLAHDRHSDPDLQRAVKHRQIDGI